MVTDPEIGRELILHERCRMSGCNRKVLPLSQFCCQSCKDAYWYYCRAKYEHPLSVLPVEYLDQFSGGIKYNFPRLKTNYRVKLLIARSYRRPMKELEFFKQWDYDLHHLLLLW